MLNMQQGKRNMVDIADCIIEISQEKIPENGEDSICYSLNENGVLIGVFDGCGGSGARQYDAYRNKTGAYVASRAVSGAIKEWFSSKHDFSSKADYLPDIKKIICESILKCKDNCGEQSSSRIKSSLSKEFPTTAAFAICTNEGARLAVDCFWAGDSRIYLLNAYGLAQLSTDDIDGIDAFENISADGKLTNVISASKDFDIHHLHLCIDYPCIVFAATDGCFGYIPSPMEFEYFLVDTLCTSDSIEGFECRIYNELEEIAGDDFSLAAVPFGYGNFAKMKASFLNRLRTLKDRYIARITGDNRASVLHDLWLEYRETYYRFIDVEDGNE